MILSQAIVNVLAAFRANIASESAMKAFTACPVRPSAIVLNAIHYTANVYSVEEIHSSCETIADKTTCSSLFFSSKVLS